MKKILFLVCLLCTAFSVHAQNFSNWTGSGNWSNAGNWSSGTGYGQLQFVGGGNATNCVNDVSGMSQWRLYFNGSVAYNLTGSGSVNLFDFGGQNSWVLSDASVNQTINFPINFNDGGARTSWITARGTGAFTFNGNIGTGGGVTALRVANTNAASSVSINTLSGSKPLIVGRDNVDTNQANTRVTLTGNSSGGYSGAVFVHAGTLFVNGSTASSSAVSVSSGNGATLAGNGTIGGSVALSGTVSPGGTASSTATLTTGGFTFNGSSSYRIEMNNATGTSGAASGWDRITSTGVLTCSASPITLNLVSLAVANFNPATNYTWPIASASSVSGFNTSNFIINTSSFASFTGTFAVTLTGGNTINLVYTAPTLAPGQPSAISGATSLCNGAIQTYSVTNDPNATSYVWTLPSGWSGSSTTNSISVTVANPGGTISVIARNSSGDSLPSSLVVSVGTSTSITTQPATSSQSVCLGTAATPLTVIAEGASLTYQWYSNTSPSNTAGTLISGATTASYTPVYLNGETLYYYCVVGGLCEPTSITSGVSGGITIDGLPTDTATYGISTGANGGAGFRPWSLLVSGGSGGTFTGSSDIGTAWGIWANSGGLTSAVRPFAAPMTLENTLSFAFDNGNVSTGSSVGFRIRNASNNILTEFRFTGGNTQYDIADASTNNTGVNFTTSGLSNITFAYTAANTYSIAITRSGVTTFLNGRTFATVGGGSVPAQIEFFNNNAGGGSDRDVFFNNLVMGRPAIFGQPSTAPQVVCQNGTATPITVVAYGSRRGYLYYQSRDGVDTVIPGATSDTYTPPTSATGATRYFCVVSYTGTCGTAPSVTSGSSGLVTVLGEPTATISGPATACQNATASITFTGANGTPPYEFQYIVHDGIAPPTAQTIVTTSGSSVSLTIPTNNIGSILYELVGVSSNVGSSPSCVNDVSQSLTVLINTAATYYSDADGDTFGNLAAPVTSCDGTGLPPTGSVFDSTDCDDNDPAIHQKFSFYADADEDGFGAGSLVLVCALDALSPPTGFSLNGDDCDDTDSRKTITYPFYADADGDTYGAGSLVQACAISDVLPPTGFSLDNSDCDDNDPLKFSTFTFHIDGDGDTFGSATTGLACAVDALSPPAGFSINSNDCDDADPSKTITYLYYVDADGDTYGSTSTAMLCTTNATSPPTGYSLNNTDCDDNDSLKFNLFSFYEDLDGDTYGAGSPLLVCGENSTTPPAGYSLDGTDCDDSDDLIYRSAPLYRDVDGDGYDDSFMPGPLCYGATLPTGTSLTTLGNDCDDLNPSVYRSATLYTDADNDSYTIGVGTTVCYGATLPTGTSLTASTTEDCDDLDPTIYRSATLFTDADNDTYTVGAGSTVCYGATLPPGTSLTASNEEDCDDANPAIFRSATLFTDLDGDTYTVGTGSVVCYGSTLPAGTATIASGTADCDDADPALYRSATLYTDVDGDTYTIGSGSIVCYGASLPAGTSLTASGTEDCDDLDNTKFQLNTLFIDFDSDTYTVGTGNVVCYGASLPAGTSLTSSSTEDCDDANASIYRSNTLYTDADGDAFTVGTGSVVCYGVSLPAGTTLTANGSDCDDANPAINQTVAMFADNDNDGFGAGASLSVCSPVDCSSNQIAVTFRVNMTGQTIAPGGVRVAGNFATRGSTTITSDWNPGAAGSQMRPIGGNIYELTVLFPAASVGSTLEFKFLRNNIWFDGTNYDETSIPGACNSSGNRALTLASKFLSYTAAFQQCPTILQGYVCNDTDCNDTNAAVYQVGTVYTDVDGDGYTVGPPTSVCFGANGSSNNSLGEDCDDLNPAINSSFALYADADNDGFGAISSTTVCAPVSCATGTIAVTFRVNMTGHTVTSGGVRVAGNFATRGSTTITSDWNPGAAGSQFRALGGNIYELTVLFPASSAGSILEYKFLRNNIWSDGTQYSEQTIPGACSSSGNRILTLSSKLVTITASYEQCPSAVTTYLCGNNTDCDDSDPSKNSTFSFYVDQDGDTYGTGDLVSVCAVNATTPPAGYSLNNTDCDDGSGGTSGSHWELRSYFIDSDGDGYDNGSALVCSGVGAPAGYSATTNGTDCDDTNELIFRSAILYSDVDGDTYTIGAGTVTCYGASLPAGTALTQNGDDCDDTNNTRWQSNNLYTDGDGDGWALDNTTAPICYGATVPAGYVQTSLGEDCDDTNIEIYQFATFYVDTDSDGYDNGTASICSGVGVPAGYSASTSGTDCDDNDNTKWQSSLLYTDADGDTYTVGIGTLTCYGATLPAGTTLTQNGDDCADTDNTKWQQNNLFTDGDGDGWALDNTTQLVCYGTSVPAGYVLMSLGEDCDDTDSDLTDNCITGKVVNLTMFIEGYYLGGGLMNSVRNNQDGVSPLDEVEVMTVELHDADAPYALVESVTGMLKTDGTLSVTFTTAPAGSYFIAVKGVNTLQTWTAAPQIVGTTPLDYDFSTGAAQAYGEMRDMGSGVFACYNGDVNRDDAIDNSDLDPILPDIETSNFGVLATDLNGDGAVDNSDLDNILISIDQSRFANYPQ